MSWKAQRQIDGELRQFKVKPQRLHEEDLRNDDGSFSFEKLRLLLLFLVCFLFFFFKMFFVVFMILFRVGFKRFLGVYALLLGLLSGPKRPF